MNCRCDIKYSGTVGSQAVVSLSSGSTGGGGSGGTVVLPLYKAPTLVTTHFDYSALGGDWQACKDVLNAIGEAGIVNWISVRYNSTAANPMTAAESVYVRTKTDGGAYTTMLTYFQGIGGGAIVLTPMARTLTSNYINTDPNSAVVTLPMQLNYTNSVQMQICPNPEPLGTGAQLVFSFDATVGRSTVQ